MLLLVGLGNPGPGYTRHRHNIGYMAVDEIVRRHSFGPFRARFEGLVAEGEIAGEKVRALKPTTYMNDSGRSVAAAARFFKVPVDRIVVIHDEVDLAPGKIRVKCGGGHAGHNGLRSIDAYLDPGYWRVRLGVGHPGDKDQMSNYVLHDFAKADAEWVGKLIDAVAAAFPRLVAGDEAGFMNHVSLAIKPPKPKPPRPPKDSPTSE
ncbi:MAG: aminoacyl-tRNA hydrolase [Proteobacteria bacterium]|nr:aminoacyl-tRNA hydrolase [Pseudomonadota bacterium]